MNGVPTVSPNGAFVTLGSATIMHYPFEAPELAELDLATGQKQHVINAAGFARRHSVANDGTTTIDNADDFLTPQVQLRQWNGTTVPLNAPEGSVVQIDAPGDIVFYETYPSNAVVDLMAVDVATGAVSEVAAIEVPAVTPVASEPQFDISDDGSLVAFIQLGQAWTVRTDGSALMQVTNAADTIVEVELSGDGTRLFAVTGASQMLRIDLGSMTTTEIIPATPMATGLYLSQNILTPGATAQIATYNPPLPEIESVSLFDERLLILSASASTIELQAPYDLTVSAGWPDAVLKQQSDGPFESAALWASPVEVVSDFPAWYRTGNYITALHQDFSGPITPDNPAHPGETIHAYGSGFGPVAPAPPLGKPAPANPLSRVTSSYVCGLEGSDSVLVPASIVFGGLAPGWIDLYQFDILLPAPPSGGSYLVCATSRGFAGGYQASGLLPVAAK